MPQYEDNHLACLYTKISIQEQFTFAKISLEVELRGVVSPRPPFFQLKDRLQQKDSNTIQAL